MPKRRMTAYEREKATTLLASGLTANAVGLQLKRDPKTIRALLHQPGVSEKVEDKRQELSEMYEALSRRMIESISDQDISKISAYQRVISSGVCTDKMRLLRGQSTVNLASIFARAMELEDCD